MKWLLGVFVLIAAGCNKPPAAEPARSTATPPKPAPPVGTVSPYEMVFHPDDLEPTFKKVAKLFTSGFGTPEAEALAKDLKHLPKGKQKDAKYTVAFKGKPAEMTVHADGGESPVVRFDSDNKELLEAVRALL